MAVLVSFLMIPSVGGPEAFIRSIVAHRYCLRGFAYDPVSLFLLELFRYLEKYRDMKTFLLTVWDRDRGRHYRQYALRGVGEPEVYV